MSEDWHVSAYSQKYKKSMDHEPIAGDMWLNPGHNEIRVFSGVEWITCNDPYDVTSENFFRKKFEEESNDIHNANPDLKLLWEEYRILRKLKTGT